VKRSLFVCNIALLGGVYAAYCIPDFIPVTLLFYLLWILFVSLFFTKRGRLPFFILLFFLLGAFHLQFTNDITKRPLYPYIDKYVTISADVIQEPEAKENGSHGVIVRLNRLSYLETTTRVEEKIYLTIPEGETVPRFGQRFTTICLLTIPYEAMNRGGFDYALYLKSENIFFRGTAERDTMEITGHFPLGFTDRIYQLNQRCGAVFTHHFPSDAAGILRAIALGDTSGISEELEEKLQLSGLVHMVSVSGMHVSILLSAMCVMFTILGRNKYKYVWLSGGVILFFMLFTGASPPVIRGCVMGLLVLLAQVFLRKEDSLTSLSIAAAVIIFINPLLAFHGGFMLSFAASLGIFILYKPIHQRLVGLCQLGHPRNRLQKWLVAGVSVISVTLAAQIFMMPVLSLVFNYTTLWSFITSLLCAPFASILLICGLLIGFIGLINPMFVTPIVGFVYPFVRLFLYIVHVFGNLKWGLLTLSSFSLFGIFLYGLAVFIFYKVLQCKWDQCLVPVLSFSVLLCVFCIFTILKSEVAEVTFINVGQGDCTLLQLPKDIQVLIDGGGTPSYQGNFDVGKGIVLPYLRKEGIGDLEYMVATHPHEDHIEGLSSLLEEIPVETVVVPIGFDETEEGTAFLTKAIKAGANIKMVSAGHILSLGHSCSLETLLPDENWLTITEEENDKSLVLRFRFGSNTALFTGDLGEDGEDYLATTQPAEGHIRILKAGHHGSATSTTETFLCWVKPQFVYIPCGQNSFGHPARATLERLEKEGATIYRADQDKDVTFVLSKTGIRSIRKGGMDDDAN